MKSFGAYIIGAFTLMVATAQADTGMALNSGVGMPLQGERAERNATYYLVQGGRASALEGRRVDGAYYYFGDFGYYGYPWGYDYGNRRNVTAYQDHGYPYDNGYYFYSSNPHSSRSPSLFKHLDTFQQH